MENILTFDEYLSQSGNSISPLIFLFNLFIATILSLILAKVYSVFGTALSNRPLFARNFVMITLTTMIVISIVKSSLALSLGLVGALSIVRFRAAIKGSQLNLQLGFSHDINFDIPEGIKISVEKQTIIKITGFDKQQVGMIVSKIKSLRPPEPYKGKGIKEQGQYILRKEGKKK